MRNLNWIAAALIIAFSINAFCDIGRCEYTISYKAKKGREDDLNEALKQKCKGFFESCHLLEGGPNVTYISHINIHLADPKAKLSSNSTVDYKVREEISDLECRQRAIVSCKFAKDDNISDSTVEVKLSGKRMYFYICGENNIVKNIEGNKNDEALSKASLKPASTGKASGMQ